MIAPTPNAGTTCAGSGTPVAVAGASTVTLPAGRAIPANGSCTLTVDAIGGGGRHVRQHARRGVLVTGNGNNPAPAVATLVVRRTDPHAFRVGDDPACRLLAFAGLAAMRGRR